MTPAEAKALILGQVAPDSGVGEPSSLLGGLRPFRGILPARCFHETMAALRVLAPSLSSSAAVDRELLSALWTLCHLLKCWALDPDGMLQSNALLTDDQVAKLNSWQNMLSYAVMILLETNDPVEAFNDYDNCEEQGAG
jgi:hypothetical protein